jgi:hypothetical protein
LWVGWPSTQACSATAPRTSGASPSRQIQWRTFGRRSCSAALVLDVGGALRVDAPAAVEEVDDGHGVSVCVRTADATVHVALARPAAVFDN